jgi:hypothetical protein
MIPRSAIPALTKPFDSSLRTLVNFDANLGGHNRFWWANRDGSANRETYDEPSEARLYPGSWAPAEFASLDGGVTVRNWLVCGPFGGPGAEQFRNDPNGPLPGTMIEMKKAVRDFCEKAVFPPDTEPVDLAAKYTGEMIRGYWPDPKVVRWKPAAIEDTHKRKCGRRLPAIQPSSARSGSARFKSRPAKRGRAKVTGTSGWPGRR